MARGTHLNEPCVGQRLKTPLGNTVILRVDLAAEMVVTQMGKWPMEDLRPVEAPTERAALEEWLTAGDAWMTETTPLLDVTNETMPCKVANVDCDCPDCHGRVVRTRGVMSALYHEPQNARCRCQEDACPCLRPTS